VAFAPAPVLQQPTSVAVLSVALATDCCCCDCISRETQSHCISEVYLGTVAAELGRLPKLPPPCVTHVRN
jgi:hypothetical protein